MSVGAGGMTASEGTGSLFAAERCAYDPDERRATGKTGRSATPATVEPTVEAQGAHPVANGATVTSSQERWEQWQRDRTSLDTHRLLSSVGLVCVCGKSMATIEGVARQCECGRIWIISAMLVQGPSS